MRRRALPLLFVVALAACGDDSRPSSDSAASSTVATVPQEQTAPTSGSSLSEPTRTTPAPTTSTAPATTVAASVTTASDPATTTPPPAPPATVRWIDADGYPSGFGMGCCGANSTGPASPALTAEPAPLADGTYAMEVVGWSPDAPALLQLSIRGLVPCADGVTDCWPQEDGTYGPDEVGFTDVTRIIDVTLDDSVTVFLAGDDVDAPPADGSPSILRSTSGTGLSELMSAIADAYETAIGAPLRAGTPADDIVEGLQANPQLGFSSAAEQMTGLLYFSFGDAPSVLFQVIADQDAPLERSGTSVLIPRTLTVAQDAITLEFYAGFRS